MNCKEKPYLNDAVKLTLRHVSHFCMSDMSYPANVKIDAHAHPGPVFCLAYEGGCEESYGCTQRRFTPFNMSFLPSAHSHSLAVLAQGMRSFSAEISPSWFERVNENDSRLGTSVFFRGGQIVQLSLRLLQEFRIADSCTPLAAEGLMLEMLAHVGRADRRETQQPKWLELVRDAIHEECDSRISLTKLALNADVHPVHLARTFRKVYGCTVGEYARRVRIEKACGDLVSGSMSLAQIAATNGFCDQSHFARVFKRIKCMTPHEYRNRVVPR